MTAAGEFGRMLCGVKACDPEIQRGIIILEEHLPEYRITEKFCPIDFYYWYFGTLTMFQSGGEKWKKWNVAMKKALPENQIKKGCAKGSWDPRGIWGVVGGRICTTAFAVLTLETYYRYNRISLTEKKQDENGKNSK